MRNEYQQPGDEQSSQVSEAQQTNDEPAFSDLTVGEAWGESITKGRAVELEVRLQAWEQETEHGERMGPFDGGALSGADAFWLAARALAGSGESLAVTGAMHRLRRAQDDATARSGIDLAALKLVKANLSSSLLAGAVLCGADLSDADLSGADLRGAHLSHAQFIGANLTRAMLAGANLTRAKLSYSRVDSVGILGDVIVDSGVDLSDVYWNDLDPAKPRDPTAGTREEQAVACRDTARVLRSASRVLRDQGLVHLASVYRLREQRMERQALWKERRLGSWLFSWLLDALAGYGEHLWYIVRAYAIVLLVFTILYWWLGIHSFRGESTLQALWDSFLVSLSAIHGRTTFEQLGAWSAAAWVAAIESVVGIIIEGVFVAMLVQRFFGGR